jgi:hypothetical protein
MAPTGGAHRRVVLGSERRKSSHSKLPVIVVGRAQFGAANRRGGYRGDSPV